MLLTKKLKCNQIIFFRNSKALFLIVALSLVGILALTIITEAFWSSDGFEYRKEEFACLVNYLDRRNVTDECFGVALSIDVSNVECAKFVEERKASFNVDMQMRLNQRCAPLYGVTIDECDMLSRDCWVVDETSDCRPEELLIKMNRKTSDEKDENSLMGFDGLMENCTMLSTCFNCVKEKLAMTNYEEIRLHASAVNLTVIEFKIWKYFTISPRVKVLEDQGKKLEKLSKQSCNKEERCIDDAVYF